MRVGFAGVGAMGAAMAERALGRGHEVTVLDPNEAACAALAKQGAAVAGSPRDLAERCDTVAIVVVDDAQVRSVVCDADGLLAASRDALDIVVHSTIHLPTLLDVAEKVHARGFALIDAGVTGHTVGARQGRLAVMVGGDEAVILRCRPLLDSYGELVLHLGPLGSGLKAKIARNLLSFAQCAAIYEGMRVAEEAGIDLAAYARIVRHSEGLSHMLDGFLSAPSVREGSSDSAHGQERLALSRVVVETARKDLSAAIDLGRSLGLRLPVAEAAFGEAAATWGAEPGPTR